MFAADKSHRLVPVNHLHGKSIFLTFDDGPTPSATEEVLDILVRKNASASFFVIAERAEAQAKLIGRMQASGFAIGNHSLDHHYSPFFGSTAAMQAWISDAEFKLQKLTSKPSIGFRSPAGVQTPKLHRALSEAGLPLIHWNKRFFDAVLPWSKALALRSLDATPSGSIVLLHDSQSGFRKKVFLSTLAAYIDRAHELGFSFLPLKREYFGFT
jgi:peptidoglycan/xylan/chitin deacetylase (PgdA/CDA1 family)